MTIFESLVIMMSFSTLLVAVIALALISGTHPKIAASCGNGCITDILAASKEIIHLCEFGDSVD